ncbi:MAG: winged helix-turn-helix domain-containing protein [Burkholderiaceae bacterium]
MESLPTLVFRFADAEFEQLSGTLCVSGLERRLRPQTAAVLVQLLEHAGQLVTHDQLIQTVWGDTIVTDNSLAQCISEIRNLLGPTREGVIETVPRRGYIFQAPVVQDVLRARLPLSHEAHVVKPDKARSTRGLVAGASLMGLLLCAALWLGVQLLSASEPARLSLAVLPFQSRAAAADQAWFAENVGEDITTNLSRIPGSHVIARVSTQAYPAAGADVRKIGRELGVRYVVAGNVDRDGSQVTMNLYLADTSSGAIVWTERFNTTVANLHTAERQVADRVANTLHVRLVAAEAQRLESHATANLAADELALEAWAAWNRGSPADVARAKELAQKALALDERSVLAWKTMASWHLRARISQSIPAEQAIAGAEAAADRAMAIDPNHALVHTVYGAAQTLRGRHEEGQKALEHEIATNPSHPVAYYYLGLSHLMRGQSKEAIVQYQRALAISPRDPRLSRFERYLALAYLHEGDLASAVIHAKAATQVPMVDRTAWAMLASVCALAGDQPCAQAAASKLRQLWPAFSIAQGESEWPPARPEFTAQHADYLRGLKLAGLSDHAPQP